MKKNISICDIDFGSVSLTTGPFSRTCRYHKKQGQKFTEHQLLPSGLCPHAYRMAYAHCLCLLYNGRYTSSQEGSPVQTTTIACPLSDNTVTMKLSIRYTLPALIRILKKIIIKIFLFFGIPAEYPGQNVIIEIAQIEGTCPRGHSIGQEYHFNIRDRNELCPASFYAAYPLLLNHTVKPSSEASAHNSFHCPDHLGVYYSSNSIQMRCEDYLPPQNARLAGLCPLAFYSIFPYYITLIHGGTFEWIKKGAPVKVQCPYKEGIIMEVSLIRSRAEAKKTVKVTVKSIRERCPCNHAQGDTFIFDSHEEQQLELLASRIPIQC